MSLRPSMPLFPKGDVRGTAHRAENLFPLPYVIDTYRLLKTSIVQGWGGNFRRGIGEYNRCAMARVDTTAQFIKLQCREIPLGQLPPMYHLSRHHLWRGKCEGVKIIGEIKGRLVSGVSEVNQNSNVFADGKPVQQLPIGWGNLSAVTDLHFIEGAALNDPPGDPQSNGNGSEGRDGNGSPRCPVGRAVLSLALLLAGALGLHKNLHKLLDYTAPHSIAPWILLLIPAAGAIITGTLVGLIGLLA